MTFPICVTCGMQYGDPDVTECPICLDDRQYVRHDGQAWTTLEAMREQGYRNEIRDDHGLLGIGTTPRFAIGQRALLVPGAGGNLLWDCVSHLDDETVDTVRRHGGIAAIAISHPHYYGSMVEWADAFDAPIVLHASDREWVQRDGGRVEFWDGDAFDVLPGRTLLNPRIHFTGGTIVHWARPAGLDGRGALCTGDIFQVVSDRRWLSFMYSYPNYIPEHPDTVRRSVDLVQPYEFDRIYGAWWEVVVADDAKAALRRSAERYLSHLGMQL